MMKPDIRRSVLSFVSCGLSTMPELRVSGSILISSNILKESNPRISNLNFLPDIIEENINGADTKDGTLRTIATNGDSFNTTIESNSIRAQLDV